VEGTLLTVVPTLTVVAGFLIVALAASIVPVEGRKLPAILRAARFPFRAERDPDYVGLATSIVVGERSIRAYRVALAGMVLLLVAAVLRDATDSRFAAVLGSEPLVVSAAAVSGLLAWTVFVIVEFRRARPKSPGS
jgi:hypothetical protein